MSGTNDRLINYAQGEDIIAALETIANKSEQPYTDENMLDTEFIGPMTGYQKAATTSALETTDTLNEALGKLEKKFDTVATVDSPTFTGTPTAPTATDGTNNQQIATTAFVHNTLKYADVMTFKGAVNSNSDLPATHSVGDTYKVATAGTYVGQTCEVGDMIICITDGTVASNADWTVIQTNEDGVVVGPSSSVTNRIATFDGTTGKLIKDSGYTVNDILTATPRLFVDNDGDIAIDYGS